jgi:hypothetical protein
MPSAQSRFTEKKRVYEGEHQAEMLVNWLNHSDDEDGKKRIRRVVGLYIELCFVSRSKEAATWKKVGRSWVDNLSAEVRRRNELEASLNNALDYYQTQPWIRFVDRFKKGTRFVSPQFDSRPVAGSEFAQNTEAWGKAHHAPELSESGNLAPPGSGMAEVGAIRYTLALLESGHIFKVRRCRCDQFFFQRFKHQRFCNEKCRINEFRSSDEARQKRNAYARKLYQLHKTKNVT